MVLDIDGTYRTMEAGSKILLWEHHGGENQMFEIVQA